MYARSSERKLPDIEDKHCFNDTLLNLTHVS
jgi:hypothetical protein